MEDNHKPTVTLFVDPSCPYAWITSRWLAEVERQRDINLQVRLLSLSVVNEHRQLDTWYRSFNDAAWAPARVMAAVSAGQGVDAGRRFYEAFGSRFHVDLGTADHADRVAVCRHALTDAELPTEFFDAAHNATWDEQLRTITRHTLDQVGLDVGVPVLLLDGVASSGPVLASIPRDGDATDLFDAVQTLTRLSGFVRYERQQQGPLLVA